MFSLIAVTILREMDISLTRAKQLESDFGKSLNRGLSNQWVFKYLRT